LHGEKLASIHWTTPDEERDAFDYFKRHSDQAYSLVDCLVSSSWRSSGSARRWRSIPTSRTASSRDQVRSAADSETTLGGAILRERWRSSSLPSVPSALRGLDLRHPLPFPGIYRSVGACDGHRMSTITQKPQRGSIKAHSWRSAITGSSRVARCAGSHTAMNATPASSSVTVVKIVGSRGATPNRKPESTRANQSDDARPTAMPEIARNIP
jgi:hypothetical protein